MDTSLRISDDFEKELQQIHALMEDCSLCPRKCHANRSKGQTGFCGQTDAPAAARAALHFWEEPCISGLTGSGAVFFSGCNLQCIFCQNYQIALGAKGKTISLKRLSQIFLELQKKGAANINLVTPTHFIPQICASLRLAKRNGLSLPVIYNTSGYEEIDSLRLLEGLVDIYLPDFKYMSSELSAGYSHAPDYFEKASAALLEMYRQVGSPVSDKGTGLLKRGMIVRHLVLPGQTGDSKKLLRHLHNLFGNRIYVSIMNQYTPLPQASRIPGLNRCVTAEEYHRVLSFAEKIGIEQGFFQEGKTASESFIPAFDGEGV